MNKNEIEVGEYYVRRRAGAIRQVFEINPDGIVRYRAYGLDSREYVNSGSCSTNAFSNWVERKATPEEISQLSVPRTYADIFAGRKKRPLREALRETRG